MRKLIGLTSILAALLLLVTSCGKQPSHINVIPGDAFGVMLIKPGELDRDDMVKQLESNDEYQDAIKEIREESEVMAEIFEDFIKDPSSIGLDMESEMYFFTAPNDEDIIFGMVIAMKKASVFEDVFKKMIKEMEMGIEIEDADGFKKVMFPMDAGIAIWDKEKILLLGSNGEFDAEEKAKELMNQKAADAITSDKDFNEFYANCLGLNFWVSSNIDNMKNEIGMAETFLGVELSNNYAHLHFGWDKNAGEFTMVFKMRFNEEIRNMEMEEIMDLIEETDLIDGIQDKLGKRSSYNYEDSWDDEWEEDWDSSSVEEITDEEMEALLKELEKELENATESEE